MRPSRPGDVIQYVATALGPAMARARVREILRAALGAVLALGLCALFPLSPGPDLTSGLYVVAPLGATAVLLFAVPNSPLAQPWSALIGNSVSALAAVLVLRVVSDPLLSLALATGLAILAMSLARALHPPGGAVAMTAALNPEAIHVLGFKFVLAPIAAGTLTLILLAIAFNRATGRVYPLRQIAALGPHGTKDPAPEERIGLDAGDLAEILAQYRQSANLGAEDLARLIAAAERLAAAHRMGATACGDIMSRDLVTVPPDAALARVAELFRRHAFTALPVVDADGRFLGVIFQIHLIQRAREDSLRLSRGFLAAMVRMIDPARLKPPCAADIMQVAVPRVLADTPVGDLLPLLADSGLDAVPVLRGARIIGIVTRSDLVASLARAASTRA